MATSGKITTSLVVQFNDPEGGGGEGRYLSAEIDGREDGLNQGDTNFVLGSSPGFLVFKSSGLTYSMKQTDGSIANEGSVSVEVTETVTFADSNEASLQKPPSGAVTWVALGAGGGGNFLVEGTKVTVAGGAKIFGIYEATYRTTADAYRLTSATAKAVLILITSIS